MSKRLSNTAPVLHKHKLGSVPNFIILASESPRRGELLRQIGVRFSVKKSNVNERFPRSVSSQKEAELFAKKLAVRKAKSVQKHHPNDMILGADTIVLLGKSILGKPKNMPEAERMLKRLSGKRHHVITAVAVIFKNRVALASERTSVWFERLSPEFIAEYVKSGEPLDKAGAYGIQGIGALCVRRIDGDYFNVVGLPLVKTVRLLLRSEAANCKLACRFAGERVERAKGALQSIKESRRKS